MNQDYKTIQLASGKHYLGQSQTCVMEVVSLLAGEKFSDNPECACPILTSLAIRTNDWMDDKERQMLWPYTTRLAGSRADVQTEKERLCAITDWACKEVAPAILEKQGFQTLAEQIKNLKQISDKETAILASKFLETVSERLMTEKLRFDRRAIKSASAAATYTASALREPYAMRDVEISNSSRAIGRSMETTSYYNLSREELVDMRLEILDKVCPKALLPDEAIVCSIQKELEEAIV